MNKKQFIALIQTAMKITFTQLLLCTMFITISYAKNADAQDVLNKHVTISVQNTEIKKVLAQLQQLTDAKFIFSSQTIDADRKISFSVTDKSLKDLFDEEFAPLNISYKIIDNKIVLFRSTVSENQDSLHVQATENIQDKTISGVITNQNGQPLAGVSVFIQGTKKGTTTDGFGRFQLTVADENAVLEISSVGFQTKTVVVGNQSTLQISLTELVTGLNEVIVVGYTTQRKKDLTGAVSVISNKDINSIPVGGVDQIMQGKAAGVAVTAQTGAPGDAIAVRIRGIGTINDNSPLYIIDGVPTKTGINEISPNDIENINILKDASSAAIYGARAANGVVIITTKHGKSGKTRVSLSAYTGIQTPANLIKMANTPEYVAAYNKAAAKDGREQIPASVIDTLSNVNWLKEVLKPAPINNLQLSISGGNENSQYIVSANYFSQDGLIQNSSYDRFNIRTAVNSSLSKLFKVGTNINLSYAKTRQVGTSGDGYGAGNPGPSVVRYALFRTPATPVYYSNGVLVDIPNPPQFFGDGLNPVGLAQNTDRNFYNYSVLGDAFVELDPIKNLKLKSDLGGNFVITNYRQFFPTWGVDRFINSPNALAQSNLNELTYNFTNTGTYDIYLGQHTINLLIGSEAIKDDVKQISASRTNFVNQSPNFQYLDNGLGTQQNGGNESHWALFSLFSRINYSYQSKYLASFNFRRDGSSRLAPDKRYGNFFSGSVGWRLDQENFFRNIKNLSLLKLRASIGQLGNQEIGNYPYTSLVSGGFYYPFGGVPTQGYTITSEGNPNIIWETSTQSDVGLDLGLYNNALQITADYFVKNTSNVLLSVPIPTSAGNVGSPTENAGKIQNSGVEVQVIYNHATNKNFTYGIIANFATLHNKVISLANSTPIVGGRIDNNYYATITTVGQPVGEFYLLQDEGIFQTPQDVFTHAYQGPNVQPGDVAYKDISGPKGVPDGVIDNYDRTYVGSPIPKFTYGLTGNLGYKNFDLSIFFQGAYGNKIYDQVLTDIEGFYRAFNITERIALNSWDGPGTSNTFPRLSWNGATNNKMPSTRFLEDGSYVRLKNVQLGYTINKNMLSRLNISNIRVYVSAQNLFTITKYTGLDPEMYTSNNSLGEGDRAVGIDWGTYPLARTFTFGLNVNF
ncbi:MAG: TonB-dependent receptor [Chitinophagaceae bacterium]